MSNNPITVCNQVIEPGTTHVIELPVSKIFGNARVNMPFTVIHGKQSGPVLLLTAAIHGDEFNGIEIIRRVINSPWIKKLRGTLIAIPIVNVLGVIHRSRYLPDRRDLNRCFPGSPTGSLAERMAHVVTKELLSKADCAIDLHTGAIHRSNLPQLRVHLQNKKAEELAQVFGTPLIIDSKIRDGTMRGTGDDLGVPIITYEGGEALRFEESAILPGIKGVRNIMMHLDMLPKLKRTSPPIESVIAKSSHWLRAPDDGFFRPTVKLGDTVSKEQSLGFVSGPLETDGAPIVSPWDGIIIGINHLPLVLSGEALIHIATFHEIDQAEKTVDDFHFQMESDYIDEGEPANDSP